MRLTAQKKRVFRLFYDGVDISSFFKAARHCSTDLERTPRPARRLSLRTTRFRHADCISHYSVLFPDYTVQYRKSLPAEHCSASSSKFIFFLPQSLYDLLSEEVAQSQSTNVSKLPLARTRSNSHPLSRHNAISPARLVIAPIQHVPLPIHF